MPGDKFLEGREVVVGAGKAEHEVDDAVLDAGIGVLYLVRPDEDGAFDLARVAPGSFAPTVQD